MFFIKNKFVKKPFRNTVGVPNSLDPEQDRHFVGADFGPNCLQRSSKELGSMHDNGIA